MVLCFPAAVSIKESIQNEFKADDPLDCKDELLTEEYDPCD